MPEEDVVAEDHRDVVLADEVAANDEGLGQSVRMGLFGIGKAQAKVRAIAKKRLKTGEISRCGDDENLADAGKHQNAQRVKNHRFVVDWQHLFRYRNRQRVETRAAPPGKDDPLHL